MLNVINKAGNSYIFFVCTQEWKNPRLLSKSLFTHKIVKFRYISGFNILLPFPSPPRIISPSLIRRVIIPASFSYPFPYQYLFIHEAPSCDVMRNMCLTATCFFLYCYGPMLNIYLSMQICFTCVLLTLFRTLSAFGRLLWRGHINHKKSDHELNLF